VEVADVLPANVRSRRVMEKIGMTHDPAEDFDHPKLACASRLFAQRQRRGFFRSHVMNSNLAVLPDCLISKIDRLFNLFVCRISKRHINLAFMLEHAKAARGRIEQLHERC